MYFCLEIYCVLRTFIHIMRSNNTNYIFIPANGKSVICKAFVLLDRNGRMCLLAIQAPFSLKPLNS